MGRLSTGADGILWVPEAMKGEAIQVVPVGDRLSSERVDRATRHMTVKLQRLAFVELTILDDRGTRIEGARVRAEGEDRVAFSDRDGRVRWQMAARGSSRLHVEVGSCRHLDHEVTLSGSDLPIAVRVPGAVAFRVTPSDEASAPRSRGTWVQVYRAGEPGTEFLMATERYGETDDPVTFLCPEASDPVYVWCWNSELALAGQVGPVEFVGADVSVPLRRGGRLEITVEGKPEVVASAEVHAHRDGGFPWIVRKADAAGRCVLDGLSPGSWRVVARSAVDGRVATETESARVEPGSSQAVRLRRK
jgi:hypothetical protein